MIPMNPKQSHMQSGEHVGDESQSNIPIHYITLHYITLNYIILFHNAAYT